MNQDNLIFWLDLFRAGYKNAYMSVIDLSFLNNSWTTRIEIVLPNVGRLCLYQGFTEIDSGAQIPKYKAFYSFASNMNFRTAINSEYALGKAVKLVYETKKYIESAKGAEKNPDMIIDAVARNTNLMHKTYEKIAARKKNGFIDTLGR